MKKQIVKFGVVMGALVAIAGSQQAQTATDITLSSNGSTFVAGDGTTALYTSSAAQSAVAVPIDIRISNIQDYAIGQHTNTLTFTVVAE